MRLRDHRSISFALDLGVFMLVGLLTAAVYVGLVVSTANAQNPGTYTSALRPGATPGVQLGHVSVSRIYPNSGNPKVFLGQSWNGSTLGLQWEIRCGIESTSVPPTPGPGFDFGTMTGWITYNQTFNGGTFTLYPDPAVGWCSNPVSGTLDITSVVSQVYLLNNIPVSSSFTGVTSGHFDSGCTLTFAMANGFGVGETSDPPYLTKPATYPMFLAADCNPADANHQFGTWGDVNDITVTINNDCTVPTTPTTWGRLKTLYR